MNGAAHLTALALALLSSAAGGLSKTAGDWVATAAVGGFGWLGTRAVRAFEAIAEHGKPGHVKEMAQAGATWLTRNEGDFWAICTEAARVRRLADWIEARSPKAGRPVIESIATQVLVDLGQIHPAPFAGPPAS